MDEEKGDSYSASGSEHSPVLVPLIGPWSLEANPPYGFVIRNSDPNSCKTEYHFHYQSNGWVTSRIYGGDGLVIGPHGALNLTPVFCDKESIQKLERIKELRAKGFELSEGEAKELLELSGMIKKEI